MVSTERSRGGVRGPLSFATDAPTYLAQADDAIFVMAQIETAGAIRNLEGIAAVDGFDYPGGSERMSGPYAEAIDRVVGVTTDVTMLARAARAERAALLIPPE